MKTRMSCFEENGNLKYFLMLIYLMGDFVLDLVTPFLFCVFLLVFILHLMGRCNLEIRGAEYR